MTNVGAHIGRLLHVVHLARIAAGDPFGEEAEFGEIGCGRDSAQIETEPGGALLEIAAGLSTLLLYLLLHELAQQLHGQDAAV